jgi:hypothetical protein
MSEEKTIKAGAALAPVEEAGHSLVLPSGRAVEVESRGAEDVVRVKAPGGACVVTIHLTDEGPVIRVEGAALEVAATKRLALDCEDLYVRASKSATIDVGGDLEERVKGSARRAALGDATTVARSVGIEASTGGVEIRAHDDVAIQGERVLLNSDDPPMPLSWEEYEARQKAGEATALPAGDPRPERDD